MSAERRRDMELVHGDVLALDPDAVPVEPRPGLKAALLASTSGATRLAGFTDRFAALFDLARERGAELLRVAGGAPSSWEVLPTVAGVELLHFAGGARVASADCGLVRIAPGVRFPRHEHLGDEWSFVLSGTAEEDGTGARWAPGDVVHRPAGSSHAFRVTSSEPFVFGVVLHDEIRLAEG